MGYNKCTHMCISTCKDSGRTWCIYLYLYCSNVLYRAIKSMIHNDVNMEPGISGEPHTSESPTQVSCRRPYANNYRENRKTHHRLPCHSKIHGVDYCTSLFVSCRRPCHSEIHGVDYCTSLFVSCRRLCHGEIHGVDYCTSLFVSCHQPCHSEVHGVDYRTSLFVSCHGLCCSVGH